MVTGTHKKGLLIIQSTSKNLEHLHINKTNESLKTRHCLKTNRKGI